MFSYYILEFATACVTYLLSWYSVVPVFDPVDASVRVFSAEEMSFLESYYEADNAYAGDYKTLSETFYGKYLYPSEDKQWDLFCQAVIFSSLKLPILALFAPDLACIPGSSLPYYAILNQGAFDWTTDFVRTEVSLYLDYKIVRYNNLLTVAMRDRDVLLHSVWMAELLADADGFPNACSFLHQSEICCLDHNISFLQSEVLKWHNRKIELIRFFTIYDFTKQGAHIFGVLRGFWVLGLVLTGVIENTVGYSFGFLTGFNDWSSMFRF